MNSQNTSITNGNTQESTGYNAAYMKKDIPFSLANAIGYHAELEAKCDAIIQKQDDLIRGVTQRCRESQPLSSDNPKYAPLVSPGREPQSADRSVQEQAAFPDVFAPMASQAFILQASDDEAEEIEQCEFDIALLRQRMRAVEDEIVNHAPLAPVDLAKKMKFIAGLVADGGEVDMDAFARLVEEGSNMLLAALGEVGFF